MILLVKLFKKNDKEIVILNEIYLIYLQILII